MAGRIFLFFEKTLPFIHDEIGFDSVSELLAKDWACRRFKIWLFLHLSLFCCLPIFRHTWPASPCDSVLTSEWGWKILQQRFLLLSTLLGFVACVTVFPIAKTKLSNLFYLDNFRFLCATEWCVNGRCVDGWAVLTYLFTDDGYFAIRLSKWAGMFLAGAICWNNVHAFTWTVNGERGWRFRFIILQCHLPQNLVALDCKLWKATHRVWWVEWVQSETPYFGHRITHRTCKANVIWL